jgi:predicted transcriptional regulator
MELHLSAEQEDQLSRVASHEGKPVEQLLTEHAMELLRENDRFVQAVNEGIAAADRGDFIDEEEMDTRVAAMLKS